VRVLCKYPSMGSPLGAACTIICLLAALWEYRISPPPMRNQRVFRMNSSKLQRFRSAREVRARQP